MVAFYNAKDQAIYDAGDKFVPRTEFLQDDFTPTEGISYEGDGSPVSYANSGIMTQAPIPGPLKYIPPNDGGGRDDDDDDPKDPKNPKGPTMSPIDAAKQAGLFFLNPLGYLASKAFGAYRKHRQRKKADNITEQASGLTDRENITKIQDYTGKKLSNYRMSRPASERNFTGGGPQANDPIGGFENKSGMGRTGYFFGGRVNYKQGGEIAGPGDTGGEGGEDPQDQSDSQFGGGGDNNTPTINKFVGSNVIESPFGKLGNKDTEIGYRGGVDLTKLGLKMGVDGTLTNRNFLTNDDIENEGTFYTGTDNDIFNTATNYDDSGIRDTVLSSNNPYGDFGVTLDNNGNLVQGNYENNYKGVDVNATTNFDDLNNISLAKSLGDPNEPGFSYGIGTNIDPLNISNSNIFAEAKLKFGQGKKDGGRIGFKNGGLASIL